MRTPRRLLALDLPKLALRDNYVSCYDYHAIIINDKRDFAGNTRAYRAGCRRKSHKTAHKQRTMVFKASEYKQKKTAQRAKFKPPERFTFSIYFCVHSRGTALSFLTSEHTCSFYSYGYITVTVTVTVTVSVTVMSGKSAEFPQDNPQDSSHVKHCEACP